MKITSIMSVGYLLASSRCSLRSSQLGGRLIELQKENISLGKIILALSHAFAIGKLQIVNCHKYTKKRISHSAARCIVFGHAGWISRIIYVHLHIMHFFFIVPLLTPNWIPIVNQSNRNESRYVCENRAFSKSFLLLLAWVSTLTYPHTENSFSYNKYLLVYTIFYQTIVK